MTLFLLLVIVALAGFFNGWPGRGRVTAHRIPSSHQNTRNHEMAAGGLSSGCTRLRLRSVLQRPELEQRQSFIRVCGEHLSRLLLHGDGESTEIVR